MKKRTRLMILPEFQVPIILGGVLPLFLILSGIYLRFNASFDRLETHMKIMGLNNDPKILNAIQAQEILMQKYFISGAIVGLVVICGISLYLSHKMAGPVYRLKNILKENREGSLSSPVKFRKGDYLITIEDDLNFCLHKSRERRDKAS